MEDRQPEEPESRIARGIAPIKQKHIRQNICKTREEKAAAVVDVETVGEDSKQASKLAPRKKSRRAFKKEAKEKRATSICHRFIKGTCPYSDGCKFSHDIAAYLSTKPADLPGQCPFTASSECPYGLSCLWAGSHKGSSQQATGIEAGGVLVSCGELQPDQASLRGSSLEVSCPADGAQHTGIEGAAAREANPSSRTQALPVSSTPAPEEINLLDRDVQGVLRKGTYDFARAQQVLDQLGVQSSQRYASKGQRDASMQQNGSAEAVIKPGSAPDASPAVVPASTPSLPANGLPRTQQPDTSAERDPACKRMKLDTTTEIGQHGLCTASHQTGSGAGEKAQADAAATLDAGDNSGPSCASQQANGHNHAAMQNGVSNPADLPADRLADLDRQTPLKHEEKKKLDFREKLYLAPLTTVGNLPFRRVCKKLGADVTCGEMALATNLLQGQASEWALMKRHPCEDFFGVQVCGGFPDAMGRCAQLLDEHLEVDFVDINMGCPIDLVCNKGAGSSLLLKPNRIEKIVKSMSSLLNSPLTIKVRKGYHDGGDNTHTWLPAAASWGAVAATVHGRTRQQRYTKQADWEYISRCATSSPGLQLIGNGDVMSFTDYNEHMQACPELATTMLARGALIKPWLFTEIKEQRHWDISAGQRLDVFRDFCSAGLLHWGSDTRGVETTRRFMLEWMSFTHRYIPVELLEVVPQRLHWRAPAYVCRSHLESLLASDSAADWISISEMLLGPVPQSFSFAPKHKANACASTEGSMAFEGQDNG